MNEYNSNPAMVRHYVEELLIASKAQASKEILEYVLEKTEGSGPTGKPISESHISERM